MIFLNNPRSYISGYVNLFRGLMTLEFVDFSGEIACEQEMGA